MKEIIKKYKSFRRFEFQEFFDGISIRNDGDTFYGNGWIVEVGEEVEEFIGPMRFITVILQIQIDEEIEVDFINQLKVNFLRGGG